MYTPMCDLWVMIQISNDGLNRVECLDSIPNKLPNKL